MKEKNWLKKHKMTLHKIAKDLDISYSLLSEVFAGKKYLSPKLALKIEEYTKQIDPEDQIKATDLINPKKLKEYKLLQKVLK